MCERKITHPLANARELRMSRWVSCTPSLWRRSPLADTPSLLASGGDILKCWDLLEDYRLPG